MCYILYVKDVGKIDLEQTAVAYALRIPGDAVDFFSVHHQVGVCVRQATKEKHVKKVIFITSVY